MFAPIPDFGAMFLLLLAACFLLALVLKVTAATARRFGYLDFATASLWFLWTFVVGSLMVAAIVGFLLGLFAGGTVGWTTFTILFFVGVCTTAFVLVCAPEVREQRRAKAAGLAFAQSAWALALTAGLLTLVFRG